MKQSKLLTKPFKQTFHITDIKHNIVEIPFITKYIPTFNILNSKIHIRDKYTRMKNTSLTFFQREKKQPPFFSKFYPIYNQERKHLKPLAGYVYNFPISQVHQYNMKQNKQQLCMSDLEFKPNHKFLPVTNSSIKYTKNTNSDIISLDVAIILHIKLHNLVISDIFQILFIPNSDNMQMIKKAIITFLLATILLIIFIEEYYNQHKFSSLVKYLKNFSKLLISNPHNSPRRIRHPNIQSEKSPSIINLYFISKKPIYI